MENAYKALMMTGGVLIGVLLLSLFVYTYGLIAKNAREVQSVKDQTYIDSYNAKFEKYTGVSDINNDGNPTEFWVNTYEVIEMYSEIADNNKRYAEDLPETRTNFILSADLLTVDRVYDGLNSILTKDDIAQLLEATIVIDKTKDVSSDLIDKHFKVEVDYGPSGKIITVTATIQ